MDQGGRFAHGEFCWADLACGDPEAAKRFYAILFGRACVDTPMPGDGGTYTLVQFEGQNVAGLYAPPPGQQPCAWSAYVAVDDCAKTTAEAVWLGGWVLAPVTDIPAVGRMAVIALTPRPA
jgi:predicted enzyme related to lactoylglutathione lyase